MSSLHVRLLYLLIFYMTMISRYGPVFGLDVLRTKIEDNYYIANANSPPKANDQARSSTTGHPPPADTKAKAMPDWAWAVLGIAILLVIIGGIIAYIVINSKPGKIGSIVDSSIPSNVGTPDSSKKSAAPAATTPKKLWKPTSDKYLKNTRSSEY